MSTECPVLAHCDRYCGQANVGVQGGAGSTGRRNTRGQMAINNDDGLPNTRPIAFSESHRNQLSHNDIFFAAFLTITKSLTYRPIIDLSLYDKVLRRPVETTG